MRILCVSSMLLFPETRFGGAKRLFHLARELQRREDVRILCLDACRESVEFRRAPPSLENVLALDADLSRTPFDTGLGLPIDLREAIENQADAIDAHLGKDGFDALWVSFPLALSFLGTRWAQRCRRVVYLEDDLSLEIYRAAYGTGGNLLRRAWKRLRHRQLLGYYRRKLKDVQGLIAISPEEKALLEGYFPAIPVDILKYGLPGGDYPFLPPPAFPLVLGFIGNFRHSPNLDALRWLLEDLFPFLRAGLPGLRLDVAGRFIPPGLVDRHQGDPDIRFLEDVPSLEGYYRSVGVFINPIVSGRGLRTKVVEAIAFGRPVISTALGAEGLGDMAIAVADTKEGMLAALRELNDPEAYRQTAAGNRRVFETAYSSEVLGGDLHRILSGLR